MKLRILCSICVVAFLPGPRGQVQLPHPDFAFNISLMVINCFVLHNNTAGLKLSISAAPLCLIEALNETAHFAFSLRSCIFTWTERTGATVPPEIRGLDSLKIFFRKFWFLSLKHLLTIILYIFCPCYSWGFFPQVLDRTFSLSFLLLFIFLSLFRKISLSKVSMRVPEQLKPGYFSFHIYVVNVATQGRIHSTSHTTCSFQNCLVLFICVPVHENCLWDCSQSIVSQTATKQKS